MPGALFAPFRRKRRRFLGATSPTLPSPPATPSTPSPADTATAYYTLLSWVSAGATKFDVYLDTVTPPVTIVVPKLQSTSYVPTLLPSKTYYWKIVAFNDGGSATGPIWSFRTPAATAVLFELAGTVALGQARWRRLSIHEVLGAQPNTAALVIGTTAPSAGEAVKVGLGTLDDDALLFGGEVQAVDQTYEGRPSGNPVWHTSLIDPTFRVNKRRPFGTWVDVSASTIARAIAARYAPDFTTHGVQEGLPAISINFDGSEDFMTCMRRLASAISDFTVVGKTTVDYTRDLKLFLINPDTESPDPVDLTHPPLEVPSPIEFSVDHSQIRTRVYGKGHGENVPTDVSAGETIVPVIDAVQFNADGGTAIAATTADGAQTQIITYEGVHLGGNGTLVGPGAAPSVAPSVTAGAGTGMGAGVYQYAYTDITASGESLPSPVGLVTTGFLSVAIANPTVAMNWSGLGGGTWVASTDNTGFVYTWVDASGGETLISPLFVLHMINGGGSAALTGIAVGPTGTVARNLYWYTNGSTQLRFARQIGDNTTTTLDYTGNDSPFGALPPSVNTATVLVQSQQVAVSAIATGPTTTTSRKLYRTAAGGTQLKLLTTLSDNATTTYADSLADASLGTNVPTSDTSALTQPSGQVNAGSSSLLIAGPGPFSTEGGWASLSGGQTVRYTGIGGATAPAVLGVSLSAGAGVDSGLHAYAYTYVTAAGESLPSPSVSITVGVGGLNQVALTGVSVGPAGTTSRNIYRSRAGDTVLKYIGTFADNVTTAATDTNADTVLSNIPPPTIDHSNLSGTSLLGIPTSGPGAIMTTVLYGSQALPAPALTGVNSWNGVTLAMAKGSSINIWVQRDDVDAQTALGALELDDDGNPTDGIREFLITDGRFGEDLLTATCDADLSQFSRPIVSASYYTRDVKTKAGRTVAIDLGSFGETGDFTIQEVTLTFDAPLANPLRQVRASSVAFTLSDLLRRAVIT